MDLENVSIPEIIKTYGNNEKDTGNVKVQVALLTKRINHLSEHLKIFKKDNHNKRSLLIMVGKRRKLLRYLQSNELEEYRNLIKNLGLRH